MGRGWGSGGVGDRLCFDSHFLYFPSLLSFSQFSLINRRLRDRRPGGTVGGWVGGGLFAYDIKFPPYFRIHTHTHTLTHSLTHTHNPPMLMLGQIFGHLKNINPP